MKNKLKGRLGAKLLAAFILFAACCVAAASFAGIYLFESFNVYKNGTEASRADLYGQALDKYSVQAMAAYFGGAEEPPENYLYGIYEGSLTAAELADAEPLAGRSPESLTQNARIHTFYVSPASTYTLADNLLDSAYVHEDYVNTVNMPFRHFVRLKGAGTLYVLGDDSSLYPLPDTFWTEEADPDVIVGEIWTEEADPEASGAASSESIPDPENSVIRVTDTGGSTILLTETTPDIVDDAPVLIAGAVNVISPDEASNVFYIQKNMSVSSLWCQDAYFEAIQKSDESRTYTVASAIADPPVFTGKLKTADFFEQADFLVRAAGTLRYLVLFLIPVCAVIGVLVFIFLMRAAGHRVGDKDIHLRKIDYFPLDLGIVIVFSLFALGIAPLIEVFSEGYSPAVRILVTAICVPLLYSLCLWHLMSLAVSFKAGIWWRRTLICRIFTLIGKELRRTCALTASVEMRTRILFLASLITLGECLAIIYFCPYKRGEVLFFWSLEKLLLFFLLIRGLWDFARLKNAAARMAAGELDYKVDTEKMFTDFASHGEALNSIGQGLSEAVGERMKSERMKTELITNVSHDIKTPLTSILSYTDLLTRLNLDDPTAREYLEVISRQSIRLKKLLEDLIEASKASSGSLKLEMEPLDASTLLSQAAGEFEDRLRNKNIDLRISCTAEDARVRADSRCLWRVFDNLLTNICKYAQPGTRAYIDMTRRGGDIEIVFRNISAQPLNISSEELLARFTRGDSSRNTEGSGLGLSIATSLMDLMGGKLDLTVDGDLFKVMLKLKGVASADSEGGAPDPGKPPRFLPAWRANSGRQERTPRDTSGIAAGMEGKLRQERTPRETSGIAAGMEGKDLI